MHAYNHTNTMALPAMSHQVAVHVLAKPAAPPVAVATAGDELAVPDVVVDADPVALVVPEKAVPVTLPVGDVIVALSVTREP